jgi:glycosyltransferase involved in cell wall biosynthesis
MEVLHINHQDGKNGGGRAAYRLHRGLRREEVASKMFVQEKDSEDDAVHTFEPPLNSWARLTRSLRRNRINYSFSRYRDKRPERAEPFCEDRTQYNGRVLPQCPEADVFNLHSIYGFLDHGSFFRNVSVPVVWTLHDMNTFTGGCQYNISCTRYQQSCGQCPQLGSDTEKDLSREVWSRKQQAYRHVIEDDRLCVVCPSRWMGEKAQQSSLFRDVPVNVIPNSLDTEVFCPRDTNGLSSTLEIPTENSTVLFLAASTGRTRKGFDLFSDAVASLEENDVSFVSVGSGRPELPEHLHHVHLGSIENDRLLSLIYSLSDIYVIPSRQDNLPSTVLESMACGTPTVGFDVGGIPDMVRPGETGWLAEEGDVLRLRAAIDAALASDAEREQFGRRCREVAKNEYALEEQGRAYRRLYEDFLRSSKSE